MSLQQKNNLAQPQSAEGEENTPQSVPSSAIPPVAGQAALGAFVSNEELEELRALLFHREIASLAELKRRLDNPVAYAQDISNVLTEAIFIRNKRDNTLGLALEKTVDSILHSSVKKRPKEFAESMFPLMGPAIRKSIVESFGSMLQNFNKTLQQVFSWQGLLWRLEAARTGVSFSDVVLLHTLEFRIEEVFLIHSSSGILLGHSRTEGIESQDADLVSGMLSAIQEFVKDCFRATENESIDTLQMGNRILIVEKGSHVSIAYLSRGMVPTSSRNEVRDLLDFIHVEMMEELAQFKGETSVFHWIKPRLDACLNSQYLDETKKVPFWLKTVVILAVSAFIAGPGYVFYQNHKYQTALHAMGRISGLMLNDFDGGFFTGWNVSVSRDPLARNPYDFLKGAGLDMTRITIHETNFASLEPQMVTKRLGQAMEAPENVKLHFENGILYITGSAPMNWILATKEKALAVPGVNQVDTSKVSDPRAEELAGLLHKVTGARIEFPLGKDVPEGEELKKLQKVVDTLGKLVKLAQAMGLSPSLIVYGHTDKSGTDKRNYELSEGRAKTLASMMYQRGIAMPINAYGFGAEYSLEGESDTAVAVKATDDVVRQQSRRIELHVHLSYLGNSVVTLENLQ